MATYSKPTKVPRWADSGSTVEPSEGKKDTGWATDDVPPSTYENWKAKLIGEWFKWIDERFSDGVAADRLKLDNFDLEEVEKPYYFAKDTASATSLTSSATSITPDVAGGFENGGIAWSSSSYNHLTFAKKGIYKIDYQMKYTNGGSASLVTLFLADDGGQILGSTVAEDVAASANGTLTGSYMLDISSPTKKISLQAAANPGATANFVAMSAHAIRVYS